VLVVDDDQRVRELLEIAFTAHGFEVFKAADGEEALKMAVGERPDVVVLDVRLPRKSGLEVCEILRRDPDEPHVPIILVSAATETDARLRGLACGADDYLPKPFSPKELIARVKRLLERTAESTEASARARRLQRELVRARGEIRRTNLEARHDNRLREATLGPGRQIQDTLDVDEIGRRLTTIVQARLGLGMVGLLVSDREGKRLEPRAIRGDTYDRIAGLGFDKDADLVHVVAGLGRPVLRHELERLPELAESLPHLVATGFTMLAALRSIDGVEGLLVMDERLDGRALTRTERDELMGFCEVAAISLSNACDSRRQTDRIMRALPRPALQAHPTNAVRDETMTVMLRASRAAWLPPRYCELFELALTLGADADSREITAELEAITRDDPTGRVRDLLAIVRRSADLEGRHVVSPEQQRAALLLFIARHYTAARSAGAGPDAALVEASLAAGGALDPATAQALNGALREPLSA
jgi:DNA-binding response OmpR family regulator